MDLCIASDHRGYEFKDQISNWLTPIDKDITFNISLFFDLGPYEDIKVDYPVIANKLAREISSKQADTGILICGSGYGVSITANRVPGVRAVVCRTEKEAEMARKHNNANVLCLGADFTSLRKVKSIIKTFFTTKFEGGRHQKRVDMMR